MVKNNNTWSRTGGKGTMKHKTKKPSSYHKHQNNEAVRDDLFERCIQKGLIEKTEYGYYFKPEFFETLDIYDEEY